MKKWWQSKTVWFNAIMATATAAEASFSLLKEIIPVNSYAVLSFMLTVGNVFLRFVSAETLVDRRKNESAPPQNFQDRRQ